MVKIWQTLILLSKTSDCWSVQGGAAKRIAITDTVCYFAFVFAFVFVTVADHTGRTIEARHDCSSYRTYDRGALRLQFILDVRSRRVTTADHTGRTIEARHGSFLRLDDHCVLLLFLHSKCVTLMTVSKVKWKYPLYNVSHVGMRFAGDTDRHFLFGLNFRWVSVFLRNVSFH